MFLLVNNRDADILLVETDLPTRTRNALEIWFGVTTVSQLRQLSDRDILRAANISTRGLKHIRALLGRS